MKMEHYFLQVFQIIFLIRNQITPKAMYRAVFISFSLLESPKSSSWTHFKAVFSSWGIFSALITKLVNDFIKISWIAEVLFPQICVVTRKQETKHTKNYLLGIATAEKTRQLLWSHVIIPLPWKVKEFQVICVNGRDIPTPALCLPPQDSATGWYLPLPAWWHAALPCHSGFPT